MRRYAPILQEIGGRLTGESPALLRSDPMRWAYALRDAVELARPDLVVSHFDDRLEADTVLGAGRPDGDPIGWLAGVPELATLRPAAAAVELVGTLAGIYRSPGDPPVAATLTGPATLAARLAPELFPAGAGADERIDLADLAADLLAALARAYADAGAAVLIVLERQPELLVTDADRAAALEPLARAAAHRRVELLTSGPGDGVPAEVWSSPPHEFAAAWEHAEAGALDLLISDGPVPAGIPLGNLAQAREAFAAHLAR